MNEENCYIKLEKGINFSETDEEDNTKGCDLCNESHYKCYQCRKESLSSVVFNIDMKNELISHASHHNLFKNVETDSHLMSFPDNEKMGFDLIDFKKELEMLEKRTMYQFDDGFSFAYPM